MVIIGRGEIIKKFIFIIVLSIIILPGRVYAYTKIKYYDFAYIMKAKGYYVDFDGNLTAFSENYNEQYYFYPFSNHSESFSYINHLVDEFKNDTSIKVDFVEKEEYSYFTSEWTFENLSNFEYCFEYSGGVACGIGKTDDSKKIKDTVDSLFKDNVSEVYSLHEIHKKVRVMDTKDLPAVLNELNIHMYSEVVNKENSYRNNFVYLGIGIVVISVLFGVIGIVLLKREEKTS